MLGGRVGAYVKLAEASRAEAYEELVAHAQGMGANAVIAMRYPPFKDDAAPTPRGVRGAIRLFLRRQPDGLRLPGKRLLHFPDRLP